MVSLFTKNEATVSYVTVSNEFSGQRLDNFLLCALKGLPRTRVYRLVRKGEVRVNKGRIKPSYRLESGDIVRIPPVRDLGKTEPPKTPAAHNPLISRLLAAVLYEDDGLIILNKPSGLASHGGSGLDFGAIEALRVLRPDCPDLTLAHRLDKDTSGCLIFCKRRSMLRAIHALLREGGMRKIYWALVQGTWKKNKTVTIPLIKNQLSSGERIVKATTDSLGQQAITQFTPLEHYRDPMTQMPMTLIQAKPITGRTHQIRVHATESGFPIAGDQKYGNAEFNQFLRQGRSHDLKLSRLFLHAQQLKFKLPGSEKMIIVEAPLDTELTAVLHQLRSLPKDIKDRQENIHA